MVDDMRTSSFCLPLTHWMRQDLDPVESSAAIDEEVAIPWRKKSKEWLDALESGNPTPAHIKDAKAFIVKCGEKQLHAIKSLEQSAKREAGLTCFTLALFHAMILPVSCLTVLANRPFSDEIVGADQKGVLLFSENVWTGHTDFEPTDLDKKFDSADNKSLSSRSIGKGRIEERTCDRDQ